MSEYAIRTLANAEYDFVRVDSALADLTQRLEEASSASQSARAAAKRIALMRKHLRIVLDSIDDDIVEAVRQAEVLDPPPF